MRRILSVYRPSWNSAQIFGGLRVALLAATLLVLSSRLLLVEWDPSHDHIVVGGSPAEQAHALAAHLRGRSPSEARAVDDRRGGPLNDCHRIHVLAIHKPVGASGAVLGTGASFAAVAAQIALNPGNDEGRITAFPPAPYASLILRVPQPPPRPA